MHPHTYWKFKARSFRKIKKKIEQAPIKNWHHVLNFDLCRIVLNSWLSKFITPSSVKRGKLSSILNFQGCFMCHLFLICPLLPWFNEIFSPWWNLTIVCVFVCFFDNDYSESHEALGEASLPRRPSLCSASSTLSQSALLLAH